MGRDIYLCRETDMIFLSFLFFFRVKVQLVHVVTLHGMYAHRNSAYKSLSIAPTQQLSRLYDQLQLVSHLSDLYAVRQVAHKKRKEQVAVLRLHCLVHSAKLQ